MKKKYRIGVTAGQFDLPHAGHMLMFKECKEHCDFLIVLLQRDASKTDKSYRGKAKHKPIMTLKERKIVLDSVKYIDSVILYSSEEELADRLSLLQQECNAKGSQLVRIIGADWKGKKYTGRDIGIKTVFNTRSHNYSTTELIARVKKSK